MGLSTADYHEQLVALLPEGPAWPRSADDWLVRALAAWGDGLAAAGGRAEQLIREGDPSSTTELLEDWERVAGLPDPCVQAFSTAVLTSAQRRAALVGQLVAAGGQTPAYYLAVAQALGYTAAVTEYREHGFGDDFDSSWAGDGWAHTWAIDTPDAAITLLSFDDDFDDPWAWGGAALLECVLQRLKPAHTTLLINYI